MVEINLEDPVLKGFLFYLSILVVKTLFMVFLTVRQRWRKKVFITSEDATVATRQLHMHDAMVKYDDEDVERVRRAHYNDLENIPLFIITGFVYVLSKPDPFVALNLFRTFTLCRFIHSFVYAVIVIPQPTRMIAFIIAYFITIYMALVGVVTFFYP